VHRSIPLLLFIGRCDFLYIFT